VFSPAGVLNKTILSVINYDSIRSFNTVQKQKIVVPSIAGVRQAVFHDAGLSYFFSHTALLSFDGNTVKPIIEYKSTLPNFSFLIKAGQSFFAINRSGYPLVYNLAGNTIEPILVLKNDLLIQDVTFIENEIWISTTSGAYCFDKKMQPLYNGKCFFSENSVTKIIKDRENNYWFGTLNKGVFVVPDINTQLFKYGNESITALSTYTATNEVLAGTSSNLIFAFNSANNSFNTIISNDTKGEIFSLYYDKPQQTIISCASAVTFYKNGSKVKEENIAGKSITPLNNTAYALAYSGGIYLLAKQNHPFIIPDWLNPKIKTASNKNFLTQGYRGRAVLFDSAAQTLYTATAEGLKYYNTNGSGFILLNQKSIFASSLCMVQGILYAGSFSDGIVKVKNTIAQLLNSPANTLATTVYKLYADSIYLWLTSDEQLQRYNTITGAVINYTSADGLPKAEIKDILVQNGKVYLATTDGLVVFNNNKNSFNNVPPLLQLNKFLVNEKEMPVNNRLTLNANENNIELFFSLLSFKDNAASAISYCINKEDWKTLQKGVRNLQLAALAAGEYTVEIKAFNEDGIVAANNITVRFFIATPFYKRNWFLVFAASLVITAMYVYFKQRLKNEKKNNELIAQKMQLEQELHQSMLASIKSQMNPHFIFNALNTVQSYIYTNEKENASQYLGKFSELTRTILDMSNKEKVTLAEEIKALQLYMELEQLRFEDKLQYIFTIDKNISTETTFIPSMLIQPYIENAIKHGLMHQKNKGLLQINFVKNAHSITVEIDDNGVGRKASEAINKQRNKKHESFSSSANQKRLVILNKGLKESISLTIIDKTDNYGNATGTKVYLNIPFL
ncbi:MAG: hypothetical protein RIS73_1002, partial [Bacteroidota bacterium]